jgi:hypothetical protein
MGRYSQTDADVFPLHEGASPEEIREKLMQLMVQTAENDSPLPEGQFDVVYTQYDDPDEYITTTAGVTAERNFPVGISAKDCSILINAKTRNGDTLEVIISETGEIFIHKAESTSVSDEAQPAQQAPASENPPAPAEATARPPAGPPAQSQDQRTAEPPAGVATRAAPPGVATAAPVPGPANPGNGPSNP